jgi:inactive dipeptidyl peptidase 10
MRNPIVTLRVKHLSNNESWITLDPPQGLGASNEDVILGTVTWASENEVAALWLNRRQNQSVLVICNADTGNCVNVSIQY